MTTSDSAGRPHPERDPGRDAGRGPDARPAPGPTPDRDPATTPATGGGSAARPAAPAAPRTEPVTEPVTGGAPAGVTDTVTAAYIEATGPAGAIRVGTLPAPALGPGDVLVRTRAVAVNHVDTFVRSGAYATPLVFPFVIGRDVVGTVAAAGPWAAAQGFAVGDSVWCNSLGHGGRQGATATYVAVAADRLYHLPAGVDPVDAAAVLHTGATAHLGLFREARLRMGHTVVIGGAAGGVGGAALRMAAATGARVLATARPVHAAWCLAGGAQEVFDHGEPDLADRIRGAAPDGVDVYWDTSGRQPLDTVVPLLAHRGTVIVSAGIGARAALPVGALYTRDARLRGFAISNASAADLADAAADLNRLLAGGRFRAREIRTLPLSRAAEAHALLESGGTEARLVLVPDA